MRVRTRLASSASARLIGGIVAAIVAISATSAEALTCRDWNRLSESSRYDRIYRMIDDAAAGQGGRSYRINRNAIVRCLDANAERMYWDFDDLCADSRTASRNAIRSRFKTYIWTCVN